MFDSEHFPQFNIVMVLAAILKNKFKKNGASVVAKHNSDAVKANDARLSS